MTTTARQSYSEFKKKHPDSMILFHIGKWYEFLIDDAEIAAHELGITLNKAEEDDGGCVKYACFPAYMLDEYLGKLIKNGHRVAIIG